VARDKRKGRRLLVLGFVAAGAIATFMIWSNRSGQTEQQLPNGNNGQVAADAPSNTAPKRLDDLPGILPEVPPDIHPAEAPTPLATVPAPASEEDAIQAYQRGMGLYRDQDLLQARSVLSSAYFSDKLPQEMAEQARAALTELAEITLIGQGSGVYAGDPYTGHYTCQAGDVLAKVERSRKLHIPWQLLIKVNNMLRPEDLQAGRRYKIVRGPFHAVVHKSQFVMDIYLHRNGFEKVYIKRLPIGTGRNGATPVGMWRIKLGGKHERPTWYPPPNSDLHGPVPYGQDNYAFGVKGLWIGLEGTDENTLPLTDYGIHSTNDPSSIGQAKSLGCIRLADKDIELAYNLLYEHWSTVEVCP